MQLIMLIVTSIFLIPFIFAGTLCYLVGNVTPAIINGIVYITLALGTIVVNKRPNILSILSLTTLSLLINGLLLLFGSAIYYLAR